MTNRIFLFLFNVMFQPHWSDFFWLRTLRTLRTLFSASGWHGNLGLISGEATNSGAPDGAPPCLMSNKKTFTENFTRFVLSVRGKVVFLHTQYAR
jgi:hypothetical protein